MVKNKGFTLAENVVAIILLGMVVTATIFSFVAARMWVNAARHHYQAISIARDRLEDIMAGGDASAGSTNVTIDPSSGLAGILTVSYPVSKRIDLTVSWTEEMWANVPESETIVLIMP